MNVLLGVGGGIAAYKAAELVRELQRHGHEVQVVMTANAERFITPLTLATLSGNQVLRSLWSPAQPELASGSAETFDIEHIRIAQQTDCIVIAPATANLIARLAHGETGDLLSAICLASTAPLLLAPAMNVNMWNHPATQANLATLRSRGAQIIEPASGDLACGMVGQGRLTEPVEIAQVVFQTLRQSRDLADQTVLITAGGTREPIDPVRYLGNRSSGKMGHALAAAALARGAKVILITAAQTAVELPLQQVRVNTAAEMQQAVLDHLPQATIVIMAAAVADYRVSASAPQKLKKQPTLTLELTQTEDILKQIIAHRRAGTIVIGFAAETENLLEEGRRKLLEKGVDAIVANDVSASDAGFESDHNAGTFLTRDREIALPHGTKRAMADRIFAELLQLVKPAVTSA